MSSFIKRQVEMKMFVTTDNLWYNHLKCASPYNYDLCFLACAVLSLLKVATKSAKPKMYTFCNDILLLLSRYSIELLASNFFYICGNARSYV